MKKLLLFILFPAVCFSVKSQSSVYHKFSDTTASWAIDITTGTCMGYCNSILYQMNGDTIFNSLTYKKIYRTTYYLTNQFMQPIQYFPLQSTTYQGALREDTINKKVYFRIDTASADTLLYDFNLNIGDTLPPTFCVIENTYPDTFIVTGFDSLAINGDYHKVFLLNNTTMSYGNTWGTPWLIEGVGSNRGLIEDIYDFFEGGPSLRCYSRNDITYTFGYTPAPTPPNSSTPCEIVPLAVNEIDYPELLISISPNPSNGFFTISSQEKITSIEIYNTLGELIFSSELRTPNLPTGQAGTELDLRSKPKGIYFVKVQCGDKVSKQKIVIN